MKVTLNINTNFSIQAFETSHMMEECVRRLNLHMLLGHFDHWSSCFNSSPLHNMTQIQYRSLWLLCFRIRIFLFLPRLVEWICDKKLQMDKWRLGEPEIEEIEILTLSSKYPEYNVYPIHPYITMTVHTAMPIAAYINHVTSSSWDPSGERSILSLYPSLRLFFGPLWLSVTSRCSPFLPFSKRPEEPKYIGTPREPGTSFLFPT